MIAHSFTLENPSNVLGEPLVSSLFVGGIGKKSVCNLKTLGKN